MGGSQSKTNNDPLEALVALQALERKNALEARHNEILRERLELMKETKALEQSRKMTKSIPKSSESSLVKPTVTPSKVVTTKSSPTPAKLPTQGVKESKDGGVNERMDKLKSLTIEGVKYRILKLLGRGGFSKVYECLDPDNELRAIKCVDYDGTKQDVRELYTKEVKLLRELKSTGRVIRIYGAEHLQAENMLCYVMERGDTDLEGYFKSGKMDKLKMKFYWKEMLLAVKTLHDNNIVHADLKPANFVLVEGTLKLIDLGLSRAILSDRTNITCDAAAGTLDYMSPEAFKPREDGTIKIGTKSDVWSLGCMLYAMLYRRAPFEHIPFLRSKLMAIADERLSIKFPTTEADNLIVVDVLKKCLQRNPQNRASIKELLEHEYLTVNTDMLGLALAAGLAKAMAAED